MQSLRRVRSDRQGAERRIRILNLRRELLAELAVYNSPVDNPWLSITHVLPLIEGDVIEVHLQVHRLLLSRQVRDVELEREQILTLR